MVINSCRWTVGGCISARRFSYGQILAISRRYCRPAFLPEGENRKCKSSPGCMLIPTHSDVKCRRIMAVARVTVLIFRMYRRPTISRGGVYGGVLEMLSITEQRGFAHQVSNQSRYFFVLSNSLLFAFLLGTEVRLISSSYSTMKGKCVDSMLPVLLL